MKMDDQVQGLGECSKTSTALPVPSPRVEDDAPGSPLGSLSQPTREALTRRFTELDRYIIRHCESGDVKGPAFKYWVAERDAIGSVLESMPMPIVGVKRFAGTYHAYFTIGVQTFFIRTQYTGFEPSARDHAEWMAKMLRKAFGLPADSNT